MAQPLITNYFNKRKRSVADDVKRRNKVCVVDRQNAGILSINRDTPACTHENFNYDKRNRVALFLSAKDNDECLKYSQSRESSMKKITENDGAVASCKTITTKVTAEPKKDLLSKTPRRTCSKLLEDQDLAKKQAMKEDNVEKQKNVIFQLKGSLSPYKSKMCKATENTSQTVCHVETDEARRELGLMTPKRAVQKDLSISEIKKKLTRSSKLSEIRGSLAKFNKGQSKLNELEQKRLAIDISKPQLQKFKAIELEVDISPQKGAYGSPQKDCSPQKGPAYQCLAILAQPGLLALPLPYTYRCLAETFRCVDTVTAMLYNRKETVTFQKLKPAVQEMLRRNFTEYHLGQVKKVHSNLYMFHQEKCQSFKSSFKVIKYELVVKPVLDLKPEAGGVACSGHPVMTPSCLLSRRQSFHQCLLKIVKDHHENFLQNLEPPLLIPQSRLTRWHPGFELEQVPDVEVDSLPQPPNVNKYTTAKDVLDKAKNLFHCNERMEKALQKVGENATKIELVKPTNDACTAIPSTSPLASVFKGIPKSLLEKVRAKQAAKAMLAMTRSPAQDHEALQHTRLPELARILRNLFVAEKKAVISLEVVLEKIANSYREQLSIEDLEQHLRLLMKVVPDWLILHNIRTTNYLRLAKTADMASITKKLEALAAEKNDR